MTKKISAILVAVILCLSMLAVSASAYTNMYVYDADAHLTTDEITEISNYAKYIESYTGITVVFAITSQTDMSNDEFAYMSYTTNTDNDTGVCIVHNTEEAMYYSYVTDKATDVFTDDAVEALENAYDESSTHYDGLMAYFDKAEQIINTYQMDNFFVTDAETQTKSVTDGEKENITEKATEFVPVDRTLPLVVDNADIIPDDVETALIGRCETIAAEYEMEVAILTVSDFEGATAEEYADDFYDYNGYGYGENDDGMLVVYKPGEEGEREIWITTHGKGSSFFFQGIREGIIADMKDYLIAEDYEKAFNTYLDRAEEQLKPGTPVIWFFVLVLVGAVIGLIITGSMTAKNKSVVAQNQAKVYTRQGSMIVTGAQDVFAYSFVDTKPKAQTDNTDSSTHTSSSGRTHNGSGAKF